MGNKKRLPAMSPEPDLVPIMNMVTILIPFLLLSAQFVTFAVIDSTLPAIGRPAEGAPQEEVVKLNLTVAITGSGFQVMGASGVLGNPEGEGASVPCVPANCPDVEAYNLKRLAEMLGQVKDQYPKEENIILVPEGNVPYEVLIATMDASREDVNKKVRVQGREGDVPKPLFPFVVIAGGVQ